MKHRTIALFYSPWPADGLARPPRSKPFAQYRYAVWYKANPRSSAYMRALQQERVADAEWVDTGSDRDWRNRVDETDSIVLLFPDSIGLGFGKLEQEVFARKPDWADVRVLNGRRREFRLNGAVRLGLRIRRFLEWTMLPELLFIPVFMVLTLMFWAMDTMRGRA